MTKKLVYFAHLVGDYKSTRATEVRKMLELVYGNVLDPSDTTFSENFMEWRKRDKALNLYHNPMAYFLSHIDKCDVLAYMPTEDGKLGSGVATEVLHAYVRGLPIVRVDFEKGQPYGEVSMQVVPGFPAEPILTIEETRKLIKEMQG